MVEHCLLVSAQRQHPTLRDLSKQRLKYDQRMALRLQTQISSTA
jgi:hypothetical protein